MTKVFEKDGFKFFFFLNEVNPLELNKRGEIRIKK